jgi:tetratricopeptide (TPR) repeat protein
MAADVTAEVSKRMRGTLLELRARYRIETGQWDGDSIEVATEGLSKNVAAGNHFLLGLSALMSGDSGAAKTELRVLEALLDDENSNREPGLIASQLRGMIELRQGRKDRAVELLRAAAEQEDTLHLSYGPPKPPKPTHELFGEMLLELGRAAEAQVQFERALERAPRRRLSLLGLTRAAAQAGDQATAENAYHELESILHRADAKLAPFATVAASNPR